MTLENVSAGGVFSAGVSVKVNYLTRIVHFGCWNSADVQKHK